MNVGVITDLLRKITMDLADMARSIDPHDGNKAWTAQLFKLMEQFGEDKGYISEYTCSESHSKEFLIDFLWWDRTSQTMVLAVESEWHNFRAWDRDTDSRYAEAVAEDFYKLLVIKSPYKLAVFSSKSEKMQRVVVTKLESLIRGYGDHRKNENYYLLDSSIGNKWFAFHLQVSEDGRSDARFETLDL